MQKTVRSLAVFLVLSLFSVPAFSQLNLGRLWDAITDQTGGAVVGATVTIIDVARGASRPLTVDSAGEYSAPSLIPGTYTIRAEAKGFNTVERQNLEVGVGQKLRVDLSLQPGEQTEQQSSRAAEQQSSSDQSPCLPVWHKWLNFPYGLGGRSTVKNRVWAAVAARANREGN
jgi:hypothetical protein